MKAAVRNTNECPVCRRPLGAHAARNLKVSESILETMVACFPSLAAELSAAAAACMASTGSASRLPDPLFTAEELAGREREFLQEKEMLPIKSALKSSGGRRAVVRGKIAAQQGGALPNAAVAGAGVDDEDGGAEGAAISARDRDQCMRLGAYRSTHPRIAVLWLPFV